MREGTSWRDEVTKARWYHSIQLPGGVLTPGLYDLTSAVPHSLLPQSLQGLRCLDVGTHDGFWSFEMEARGADEVVAIDLDDPTQFELRHPVPSLDLINQDIAVRKHAFETAHLARDSKVRRVSLSVYDLSAAELGTFDFAFIGTLLHHLRDPVGALMAIRRVVTGELVVNGVFSVSKSILFPRTPVGELLPLTLPSFWNVPNLTALRSQVGAAGWEVEQRGRPYLQHYGEGWTRPSLNLRSTGWHTLVQNVVLQFGVPHQALRARPAV